VFFDLLKRMPHTFRDAGWWWRWWYPRRLDLADIVADIQEKRHGGVPANRHDVYAKSQF
jgi:hypothetical protein